MASALNLSLWSLHLQLTALLCESLMLEGLHCTYGFVDTLWQPVDIHQQQPLYPPVMQAQKAIVAQLIANLQQ